MYVFCMYGLQCTDIVEDYGPYLMSLLAQATDKGHACAQVNLCPAQTVVD